MLETLRLKGLWTDRDQPATSSPRPRMAGVPDRRGCSLPGALQAGPGRRRAGRPPRQPRISWHGPSTDGALEEAGRRSGVSDNTDQARARPSQVRSEPITNGKFGRPSGLHRPSDPEGQNLRNCKTGLVTCRLAMRNAAGCSGYQRKARNSLHGYQAVDCYYSLKDYGRAASSALVRAGLSGRPRPTTQCPAGRALFRLDDFSNRSGSSTLLNAKSELGMMRHRLGLLPEEGCGRDRSSARAVSKYPSSGWPRRPVRIGML
jgi:hypothetical protein